MRNKFVWLLAVLLSLPLAMVPSGAQATSVYDNVIQQGSLTVENGSCSGDVDMIWDDIIDDPGMWTTGNDSNQSTISNHFATAKTNGVGWAVIQREAKANHSAGSESFVTGDKYLTVLISANSSTEFSFTSNGDYGQALLPDTNVDVVQIAWTGGSGSMPCELKVIGSGIGQSYLYSPLAIEDTSSYFFNSLVRYKPVFANFDIDYGSGYGGVVIPSEAPSAKYVAMGDSFSSGEGNPPFEYGTDEDDVNECHRSPQAYPRLLKGELDLGSTAFVACSGATTSDVLYGDTGVGNWSEGPQVDALSEDTEVVTITIGGNDVGFSSYVLGCLVICGPGSLVYNTMIDSIEAPAFEANLETTFEGVLEDAPNAQVYVIDYPYLSASNATDCGIFDFRGARGVQVALNSKIEDAVEDVNDLNLHYIDSNASGSPFDGNHLCNGGTSDFNGFNSLDWEYSFHPNNSGHEHYKEVVTEAID